MTLKLIKTCNCKLYNFSANTNKKSTPMKSAPWYFYVIAFRI